MNNFDESEYPWHQSSWNKIANALSENHLPHALLITGNEGTGKKDFSEQLAQLLLCTSVIKNKACGDCPSCKTYLSNANPDFLRIGLLEDKQQISVDQIRQLSKFISYTRSYAAYRVILLNPTERMNKNAANSLLKSLEEPASNTIIILVATSLSDVIPTIKSRCQLLSLPTPNNNEAISWLKSRSIINPEELLEIAQGQPLTALNVSDDTIKSRLEFAKDISDVCTNKKSLTEIAKKWEKYEKYTILNWQISWVENHVRHISLSNPSPIKNENSSNIFNMLESKIKPIKIWDLHQKLIHQKQYAHTSVNPLLFIENMLLLWLQASNNGNQRYN